MEKQVLDTFPKLIEEYTDIIKQSAIVLKEKQILVDRETRRIRVPPLDSDITLFGVPVQPLLTAYHGIEGVENDEALSGWDDLALAIADNESHSTVGRLARVVFPTYGFPSDSIATGTQFLGLCARAGVGRLYGDGETEVGVKRKTMFIGFTRRAVYFSRMRNLYGKSGPYRADAKGARGLIKADFTTAYTLEQSPILIRPSLAGIRALLLEAYPDERPGLDIVLGRTAHQG